MLLVKTKIKQSLIEGIGLFADQIIPNATIVWEFSVGFDLQLTESDIETLSTFTKNQILKYIYLSKNSGKYILCADEARYFNHSSHPNVSCDVAVKGNKEVICYANRTIFPGEELTCDYTEFDASPLEDYIENELVA